MFRSAATKIAHNSTLPSLGGNSDLRPLQNLILAEKQVLISLQKVSEDILRAADALRIWGSGEGEDLDDILGASTTLLTLWAGALSNYAMHGHSMRDYLKSIRTREEMLDELKKRRKAVSAKADAAEKKLSRMGSEHKNLTVQTDSLNVLRIEIRGLDSDIMTEEAAIGDFKRTATRAWMGLKFGGLLECAEKGTIAGEFGKLIITEISEEQTQPGMARSLYYGRTKTEQLLSEAHRCIHDVVMSTVPYGNTSGPPAPFQQLQQTYPQHTPQPSLQGTPQIPYGTSQPTFQGIGPQGTDIRPPQLNSNNNMATGGPQLDFSPAPQLYLNQPGSPIHEYYSPQASHIGGQAQPDFSDNPPRQSVDDFGVNTRTSGFIDQPENGSGGRFATFPVKNRPTGYALSDPSRQDSDSFSSSVAQALSSSQSPPVTTTQADFTGSNTPSLQHPVPSAPPHFLPPGAAPPEPWHADPHQEASNGDGGLAYMDGPRESRHVRFGEVSDVDDEFERRGRHSNDNVHHYQQSQTQQQVEDKKQFLDDGHPPRYQDLAPTPDFVGQNPDVPYHNDRAGGELANAPLTSDYPQKQRRVPPPMMELEDERALNAAAAREVSQELKALNLGSPKSPNRDSQAMREMAEWNKVDAQPQPSLGHNASSSIQVDNAPLAPPVAPFSGRLPSPNPDVDSPTLPYTTYNTPPTTAAQPNPEVSYFPDHAYQQQRPPSPAISGVPRLGASLSAARNESPRLPPLITQPSSSTYGTPYQTPPEYPRGLGASSTSVNRSSPSLPAQIPPGARTISAAAFKRPQRIVSGEDSQNTSPLSIKKRLPSSPHPQRDGSPQRRGRSGSPAQPPTPAPAQALPPIPTGEDDEDYDYLSAYVETGVPPGANAKEPQQAVNESQFSARPQGGYGEGRFATDLEGGLR